MKADKHYYVNADRSKVVDRDDPEAAYLLAAEGDDISTEDAKRYKLGRYAPEQAEPKPGAKAEEQPAESKAVDGPPENKAMKPAAKKADEGK